MPISDAVVTGPTTTANFVSFTVVTSSCRTFEPSGEATPPSAWAIFSPMTRVVLRDPEGHTTDGIDGVVVVIYEDIPPHPQEQGSANVLACPKSRRMISNRPLYPPRDIFGRLQEQQLFFMGVPLWSRCKGCTRSALCRI